MKIEFWMLGDTTKDFHKEGLDKFCARITKLIPFETRIINTKKGFNKLPKQAWKKKEALLVMDKLQTSDHLILLDEKGKSFTSANFAKHIDRLMNLNKDRIVFLVGGPWGFDESLYGRAQGKLAISEMTFSHQLIRVLFAEQLYRGLSILKGLPYHNE